MLLKRKIYIWYQNAVMASWLGGFDLARRLDNWMFTAFFED